MTLWAKLTLLRSLLSTWTEAEKEIHMGKSLLTSKTFWLNVVAIAIQFAGFVPLQYGVPALALLNVVNRLLTDQPITSVLPS